MSDLEALAASSSGKVEIDSLEEGREGAILENLIKAAVLTVFKERVAPDTVRDIVAAFDTGTVAQAGDDVPSAQLADLVQRVPGLDAIVAGLTDGNTTPSVVASAVEFVLEGLHLSKRLNKDGSATYRSRN